MLKICLPALAFGIAFVAMCLFEKYPFIAVLLMISLALILAEWRGELRG